MFDVIKFTYLSVAVLMAMSSCSQGGDPVMPTDNDAIKFSTAFGSEQRSRSYDEVNEDNLNKFNVTSFYSDMSRDADGTLKPYFVDVTFEKTGGVFASSSMSAVWPPQNQPLKFLAYYPTTYSFSNQTKSIDKVVYKMDTFNVDPEISNHIDFVAAYQETPQCETVQLGFKHQLSRVKLLAMSENGKYNFDIAGVRLGSQASTATFDFVCDADHPGSWSNVVPEKRGVSHTYLDPEKIVTLIDDPQPIMTDGGPAMVVPITEKAWVPEKEWGSADGGKMYFSILLRVTRKDGSVFYPYQNGEHKGLGVYPVVDKERDTLKDDNGQPMVFGWAAVPVEIKWEAGKSYTYTLDFTKGIGRHDPEDPEPGHPIEEGSGNFGMLLSVEDWNNAPAGSYNPDVPVPYE